MSAETIGGTLPQTNLKHETEQHVSPDMKERGIDELNPTWNIMGLTREARGTFYAKLEYPGSR